MTTTMPPARIAGIDLLRVLGILAIVAGHVWHNQLTREALYTWHVPLFFVLSGYFWRPGRALKSEVRTRWTTLIQPYLFWLVLVGILWFALDLHNGTAPASRLAKLIVGGYALERPFSAFWFVTALAAATILLRIIERLPGPSAAWLLFPAGALITAYVNPAAVEKTPLAIGSAIASILFIVAGMVLRHVYSAIPHRRAAATVTLALCAVLIIERVATPLDIKAGDFGRPMVSVVVAIAISWALIVLARDLPIPTRTGAMASELAVVGVGVILVHSAVLYALRMPPNGNISYYVACVALSWLVALPLHRTGLSNLTLGVPRPQGPRGSIATRRAEWRLPIQRRQSKSSMRNLPTHRTPN